MTLETQRAHVAALKSQIAELDAAPRAHSETLAAIRQALAAGAADRAERLDRMIGAVTASHGDPGDLLAEPVHGVEFGSAADMGPLLALVLGVDTLMAVVEPIVRARGADGPTTTERAERLQRLRADLFEAELLEEALVVAAEARGENVTRRGDANPAAVLALTTDDDVPADDDDDVPAEAPTRRTGRSAYMQRRSEGAA